MEDNVLIKIKTYQDIDGDGDEPIELETPGKFGTVNGKYYIMYNESELTGFRDTKTTIKVWDKNVTVVRKGNYNTTISYTEGERNLCLYKTEYGEVGASIKTFDIDFAIDADAMNGEVKVDYTLDTDNTNYYKNSLNIHIEPLKKTSDREPSDHAKSLYVHDIIFPIA